MSDEELKDYISALKRRLEDVKWSISIHKAEEEHLSALIKLYGEEQPHEEWYAVKGE